MATGFIPPFVDSWRGTLRPTTLRDVAPEPSAAAIFSADMINGFVHFGPLASARVGALAGPVTALFERSWAHGIREFVLCQDTHHPSTPEFEAYPAHCIAGSPESETITELGRLPFAEVFTIVPKNSLSPSIGTGLDPWLAAHPEITTAIVVGDCTDLCTYQLAMYLRMRANAFNVDGYRVIVPVDAVDTFDIPHTPAEATSNAHPAGFFHAVFLYHMAQNGIEIVTTLG